MQGEPHPAAPGARDRQDLRDRVPDPESKSREQGGERPGDGEDSRDEDGEGHGELGDDAWAAGEAEEQVGEGEEEEELDVHGSAEL